MKCSLGISNFLEEISSLSHSLVFLYFFALVAEEDFLISSCYFLELCIQMLLSFLFSFAFCFSFFHSYLKVGLKLNIQKTKIIASGPITSWEIDGETLETVSDFIFGAPKSLQMVTAAMKLKDAYSLEGTL